MLRMSIGFVLCVAVALAVASASAEEAQKLKVPKQAVEKQEVQQQEVSPPSGLGGRNGAVSPIQVKPELQEKKELSLDKPALQRLSPRFHCSVRSMFLPLAEGGGWTGSVHADGVWQVEFNIVNHGTADEVKVVIELWSWSEGLGIFSRYPGATPALHEYTDVDSQDWHTITYEQELSGSVAGCHLIDEDPSKAFCKYRVSADISYRQNAASGGSPPRRSIGSTSSSASWLDGTQCEDVMSWTATE